MKQLFVTTFFILACSALHAQGKQPKELRFNHLYVEDGMPATYVNSLAQDKEGYIWAGTLNGLVKYDGYTTKTYAFGIEDVPVSVVSWFQDRTGTIWTSILPKGLYYYDRTKDSFVLFQLHDKYSTLLKDDTTWLIRDDAKGNLWLKLGDSSKNVLLHVNTKTGQSSRYSIAEKGAHFLNAIHCTTLVTDRSGNVWAGTDNGLFTYDSSKDAFVQQMPDSITNKNYRTVTTLLEDAHQLGILWFISAGTETRSTATMRSSAAYDPKLISQGIWRYDARTHRLTHFGYNPQQQTGLLTDSIWNIQNDKKGNLWLSTSHGLCRWNSITQQFISHPVNNTDKEVNWIREIAEDKKGNFWCRTQNTSLLYFDTQADIFNHYEWQDKEVEALRSGATKIMTDQTGSLWLLNRSGVQWLNEAKSRFIYYNDNPLNIKYHYTGGTMSDFTETPDGIIWIAAISGLWRWDSKTNSFLHIKLQDTTGYQIDYLNTVKADKEGIVWCGSYSVGLFSYNPKTGAVKTIGVGLGTLIPLVVIQFMI